MRRKAVYAIDDVKLWVYERMIRWYLRYVLLRCAKYTNSKAQAERITFYALVTACLLAGELEHVWQLGLLMDTMVDVVGEDVRRGGHPAEAPRRGAEDLLIADEPARKLADAMNGLDGFARELLVLCHMERIEANTLSQLLDLSAAEIRVEITRGETALAALLPNVGLGHATPGSDVHALLSEFAAGLDSKWAEQIAGYALSYLAEWDKGNGTPPPYYWTLN